MTQATRGVAHILNGLPATDGAGVKLTRILGTAEMDHWDPFLLLDHFTSDNPDDYIAGFPPHPHRGFETVTYLLAGRMRHKDNAGHEGVIEPGGVQWMTAGRGIVHSEMPEQDQGRLSGFQLWVNLPASDKMTEPAYREYDAGRIPLETNADGTSIRVISGRTDAGTTGPVQNVLTDPLYLDITLAAGGRFRQALPDTHNAMLFVITGSVQAGDSTLQQNQLGLLQPSGPVTLTAIDASRLLLIAGRRLHEPVVRHGPFVMNTREQILQAIADFKR